MSRHRSITGAFVALLFLPAAGLAANASVEVGDDYFRDAVSGTQDTTINVGDTVSWTWVGTFNHSTTSGTCPTAECDPDGKWDSGEYRAPHVYSHTFTSAGTFHYFCTVHDRMMQGSVTVNGAGGCGSIVLAPASLLAGIRGSAYEQRVSASGGTAPYAFSLASGALPPGIHLDDSGELTGTPTADGAFPLAIKATDAEQCSGTREYSVTVGERAPAGASALIPGIGALAGAFGAFFRTQLQLNNPGTAILAGKIVYHAGGVPAAPGDPSIPYALGPRQTVNFDDVLTAMGLSGLGSADIVPSSGDAPVAVARIFNDGGDAGTAGFTEPVFRAQDALAGGDSAVFILPADPTNYRFNLGVRSLGSGVSATFRIYDEDGSLVATVSKSYPANFFVQAKATDFLGVASLPPDGSIEIAIATGSAVFFGSTVDNRTQDTSTQFTGK